MEAMGGKKRKFRNLQHSRNRIQKKNILGIFPTHEKQKAEENIVGMFSTHQKQMGEENILGIFPTQRKQKEKEEYSGDPPN